MASKRNSKINKIVKDYNNLKLSDVICPICRTVLVEPVSLPCNHDFCLLCFEGTMENANLVCPLCRLRIGSWLRKVRKENLLVNKELWKIIKEEFSQHVNNKLNGIDENLDEKPEIVVAYPGEIRKEYELQMLKQEEENTKKRLEEQKASEELIKKLIDEENYQKVLLEEKLKLDEKIAKQLSDELSKDGSKSKIKVIYSKKGPLDKFVEKNDAKSSNSFVNKEYTCRVLCLDNNRNSEAKKVHKKIQQIQSIIEAEVNSDCSDCIESEMRYFKPIDYRSNPPTQCKLPVKVTPKKIDTEGAAKIMSPSGLNNFSTNLESAFARYKTNSSLKRSHSPNLEVSTLDDCKKGPPARKKLFESARCVESPPFYGFDTFEYTKKLKEEQEKADLELAKKLQEELNRYHFTRSRNLSVTKKQKTIDDMIKSPYKVK